MVGMLNSWIWVSKTIRAFKNIRIDIAIINDFKTIAYNHSYMIEHVITFNVYQLL